MKGFFTFAIVVALGFMGYIAYPSAVEYFRSQNWLPAAPAKPAETAKTPEAEKPAPVPSPAPTPAPAPEPAPAPAPPPPAPATATDAELERLVPMPKIKSLEEITSNWASVPQNAFPPQITLKADAVFQLPQGNTMRLSAGKNAVPVSLAADGTLTVTMRAGSELAATLPVDQTDFKELVTKRYEEGVARIKERIVARREEERARIAAASTTSDTVKAEAGEVPQDASDEEKYLAIMKQSVANGELKDVTPDKVKSWRWIGYEEIGGTGYWTGAAIISKETYFGEFETEAKALIRQGKVEKWTLPGVQE
jgi:hypothetical protein